MNWANTSLRKLKKLSSSKPSLFLAFFSCFAWIYIAGRLWQDAENRTLLANLLQQNYNQSHHDELEAKFFEERAALEAKYQKLYQPLYTKYPFAEASISGDFFEALTSSEFYKNAKVRDISGSFRWLPFLALQSSNSFLTMLLLLSKYRMKSVPVVDLGEGKIENIITQSAVIHMLEECAGLQWFESWGTKSLSELGLPLMKGSRVVKVCEDEPVLQAFKLMRQKGVGAVPVVESGGNKAIANISIRDIQFLLLAPAIYKNHRFSIANKSCWLEPSVNYLTSCIYLGENVVFPVNEGTTPCWLSLKALGRARLGMSKREFLVVAKARKMHSDDFRKDTHGVVSGLRDGGYSDDMTLAAIAGAHKRLITSPPVAVFPHPLASDLTFARILATLVIFERSGKTWRQDQKVRLQHVETLDYLQSHNNKFSRTAGVSKRFLVKN